MSPKGDLIGIAENDGTSCEKKILLSTLSMSGYLTNQNDLPPPLLYGYWRVFSLFFLNWNLVLYEKDQNPKAQPSTFKIEALRIFWKIDFFGENPK